MNTSVWLAFRNRRFLALWMAGMASGICVSAHDTVATWLMNALGASPLLLSLMATIASLPFFDEILEYPGTFRTEMMVGSWAEYVRQHARMTKAETDSETAVGAPCDSDTQ